MYRDVHNLINKRRSTKDLLLIQTCFGVSSSVADHLESRQDLSFVVVGVQLELRFSAIAVLYKRHLFPQNERQGESRCGQAVNTSSRDHRRGCYLHADMTNNVKGSNHAEDKLTDFSKAFISDTPRAIDQEHKVSLCSFAHCRKDEDKMSYTGILINSS